MAGRPKIDIDIHKLSVLMSTGMTKTDISSHFEISRPTLDRIIEENNLTEMYEW